MGRSGSHSGQVGDTLTHTHTTPRTHTPDTHTHTHTYTNIHTHTHNRRSRRPSEVSKRPAGNVGLNINEYQFKLDPSFRDLDLPFAIKIYHSMSTIANTPRFPYQFKMTLIQYSRSQRSLPNLNRPSTSFCLVYVRAGLMTSPPDLPKTQEKIGKLQ